MKLTLEPIWPLPLVVLAVAGLLAVVLLTYPQRVRHLRPRDRRLLIGLRLAALALIALAMLRPVLQVKDSGENTFYLYFLADSSRSMSTPDGPGSVSRRQALLRTLEECRPVIDELAGEIEIRYADFAGDLQPAESLESTAEGPLTDLAGVLRELLRETDTKRILGVVLMSDGAPRVAAARGTDQRERAREVAREFAGRRVPIHPVPYGGSGVVGSSVDIAVEDLLVDPYPFERKVVPVKANLRIAGAAGRRLTARILVEDRTGKKPGEAGPMVEVEPLKNSTPKDNNLSTGENRDVLPVELSFVPLKAGEYKVAFEAVPLDDELKTTNNRLETIITVQSGGISVAYFNKVALPEQKFVRNVNASEKIQLDFYPVRTAGGIGPPTKIDPRVFESGPAAYDVYMIGDVPAAVFGRENLEKLAQRVEKEGAGLLMAGGYDSFGPGGYADTPLARLLPVAMSPREADIRKVDEFSDQLHYVTPLQMVPTDRGLAHFVMRIDPDQNHRERWMSLPELEGANKLQEKRGGLVEVLARTPDGTPLLLSHEFGPARVMAFGADSTWQWFLGGQAEAHQRFWRQAILYLAHKEDESDQPVWVRVAGRDARTFLQNSQVPLEFGARTPEGKPLDGVDFRVTVIDPESKEHQVPPVRSGEENTAAFRDTLVPGDYWVRVEAEKEGGFVGSAWTRFLVEAKDLELDNPAADLALMEDLAAASGGTNLKPENLKEFLERLRDEGLPGDDLLGVERITLWDTWPRVGSNGYIPGLLVLFVAVMSLEWFLRKRKGLV